MFYNGKGELPFVGKARKLRQRIKKHFEDPVEQEIYGTYIANKFGAKYNIDKLPNS